MAKAMTISESDYEALPPALRRKYFSSVERLRIAEHAAAAASHSNPSTEPRIPLYPCQGPGNPVPTNLLQRQSTQPRRRLRKSRSVSSNLSQVDAQWFLALPEKVRRRHFSQEEQVLLAGRCEGLVSSADYEFPPPTRRGSTSEKGSSSTVARGRVLSPREYTLDDSNDDIDTVIKNAFQFLERTDSCELEPTALPSSSGNRGTMAPSPPIRPSRPSFRRTLSFSPNPFARHSMSSPPLSPHLSQHPTRPRASSFVSSRPSAKAEVPALPDPDAKYYHDPDARKKLKLYLGSPERFDEVVEYGFPSDSTVAIDKPPQRPKLEVRKPSNGNHAYIKNHTVFFLEDSDGSDDETDDDDYEYDTPPTPAESEITRYNPRVLSSKYSSIDSAGLPSPSIRQKTPELFSNREMTLRMTLTRPDLRTAEGGIHLWQSSGQQTPVDENPLALAALPPPTDDNTGSGGPFSSAVGKERGIVQRLWKRVMSGPKR